MGRDSEKRKLWQREYRRNRYNTDSEYRRRHNEKQKLHANMRRL